MDQRFLISLSLHFLIHFLLPFSSAQLTLGGDPPDTSTLTINLTSANPTATTTSLSVSTQSNHEHHSAAASLTNAASTPSVVQPSFPTSNPPVTDQDGRKTGILNYYFLLLAFLILILIILYLSFARNRRKRLAQYQDNRQHALHRDIYWWRRGTPWVPDRREHGAEGLNERGEAPPPYMPNEPPPVFHPDEQPAPSPPIALREVPNQQKPPEYSV